MKKGDLVRYEYLARHPSGVGWEFHKGIGIIVEYNAEQDSHIIMTEKGNTIERLDIQIDLVRLGNKNEPNQNRH